ncbi:MAG: hypothetical protein MK213_10295, partial [Planctomycetes bacterium]|nr:hypothetical protein [Planctomycetota bacterium]
MVLILPPPCRWLASTCPRSLNSATRLMSPNRFPLFLLPSLALVSCQSSQEEWFLDDLAFFEDGTDAPAEE